MKDKIFFILGKVIKYYKTLVSKKIFGRVEKSWLFILVKSVNFFFFLSFLSCSVVFCGYAHFIIVPFVPNCLLVA